MGVDLRLLPFDYEFDAWASSYTVLDIERRRDLWDPIAAIEEKKGHPVPPHFNAYTARLPDGESGYGAINTDDYGREVHYVLAADLVALRDHESVQDNAKNRAVWAYLTELRADTKIALQWH